jgi:cytochrome bd-type quinol oxidase subunit 1
MNASSNSQLDSLHQNEAIAFAQSELGGIHPVARAGVVNRTHRVVRERAKVMQARRSRVYSLVVPLIICSVLLLFICLGLWVGIDQYQAVEIDDVASLAATEASRHFLVVLLWFVPVSMAMLAAAWFHRRVGGSEIQR